MSEQDDSFFSRWSRRKAQVRQGTPPPENAAVAPPPASVQTAQAPQAPTPVASMPDRKEDVRPETPQAPPPTMEDVQALTPESDFSRFLAPEVDPQVKNSAMKKLFADPHFNVMDGLDTYIDDYHTPDPLPKALLRQLVQARSLGLLDDEMPEQPVPAHAAPPAAIESGEAVQPEAAAELAEPEVPPSPEAGAPPAAEEGGDRPPAASAPQPSADRSSPAS